jgi:hypothetical protein
MLFQNLSASPDRYFSNAGSLCSHCENALSNRVLLDQLNSTMSHTMKICNLLQSTQDDTHPTLASSQRTVSQDPSPTTRDTCLGQQEKIPEMTAMQDLPFIPATVPPDSVSIRLQNQQKPHPKQNNTSYDSDSHQHKQLVRVRGPLVKAACLACRKRKSKVVA